MAIRSDVNRISFEVLSEPTCHYTQYFSIISIDPTNLTAALCNFSNAVRGITAQALSNLWKQALCMFVWLHALHVLARLQFNMRLFVRQFKACKLLVLAFILSLLVSIAFMSRKSSKKNAERELVNTK